MRETTHPPREIPPSRPTHSEYFRSIRRESVFRAWFAACTRSARAVSRVTPRRNPNELEERRVARCDRSRVTRVRRESEELPRDRVQQPVAQDGEYTIEPK